MTQEHSQCLICNSADLKKLTVYDATNLWKCQKCNFVFSKSIPTTKELITHYEKYNRNDYLSPITILRYNELLDEMEPFRKTNKLLDVGCGIGYFLEEAKKRGWEVYGTEFTDEAIEICTAKGINMNQGVLNSFNYDPESFDIITSFEVIEHINNPKEELSQFHGLLRKGGLCYVTTPNFNSLLRYRLKAQYNIISYPEHLSYYTPRTLKNVYDSAGFKVKKIVATGISLTRLRTSKGKSKQAYVSETSDDELLRNQIEQKWYLKFTKTCVNTMLTFIGKGDNLKGWFIRQ